MNKYRKQMAEQFLSQALSIICLLTGEEYAIVKKKSSHSSIHRQSREVPIKCDDVAVYFSMEEWEYIEGHKELYKDVMMETHQALRTMEIPGNESSELTGHSGGNLNTEAQGELEQNIQSVETASDISAELTGHSNKYLDTEAPEEIIQNIQPVETPSDVAAGEYDAVISCNLEQTEDQWLRNMTESAKQEICENVRIGRWLGDDSWHQEQERRGLNVGSAGAGSSNGDVKTEVTLNAEQTDDLYVNCQQEVVKQEVIVNISTGEFTNCNNPSRGQSADVSFNLHQNLRRHMGNVCSECGKCFTCKSQLTRHQKYHKGEKPFSCSECGKCFTVKSDLGMHQRIHTGEKAYSCSECGKRFSKKSHLTEHQPMHTGEKAFSCLDCGKCFTLKSNLTKHQKIHTGEKAFSCSECGKCFIQKSNLISHQRIHTGEKAFSCSECEKSFSKKSSFVKHQKIHLVEKGFSYSECGKCLNQNLSNNNDDQKVNSVERGFSCSDCGKCFTQKTNLIT
ncbi:zinc finger protein 25-like [Bombina bombina]|uniref:zinc finger protein 25-like n=1 Tax=Bombina bombina TaxID=8345 RepID=UPI00235A781E|nr:zinc finger protein 25-like [Bombina bombina]